MTVVANPNQIVVYINGEKIKTTQMATGMKQSGYLSYTLSSGSTRDFGLRCKFSDTWLWAAE